jgi:N-methylhydantoinase A
MAIWVGVDVGGTFTDFIAYDDDSGDSVTFKTQSTPKDPANAIVDGLKVMMERYNISADSIAQVGHGTTVGTNTLIQRKGARVALITTKGFRDVLEIGRQTRPGFFDMYSDWPPAVVPRTRRFEIDERVGADGQVRVPLTDAEIARVVQLACESDVDAFAVSLLFGYLTPDHERRIGAALAKAAPEKFISLSSDVQPEFREYERTSTTTQNAYLQPMMQRYLTNLADRVGAAIPQADVVISQSSGGLMSIDKAQRFPIRTALSGPAAGVLGALEIARLANRPHVVTFDMGGTSADVALVRDLMPAQSYDKLIGGLPVRLPSVDISTIGAGGGSIAHFDRDDRLKVGPISAGADPGPACYGLGGERATVTDANLVLGRLSPAGLLDGSMKLDRDAAVRAIRPIADQLGLTIEHTAHGIIEIVVSNMARIIRAISVNRGYDPRDLSLLAFGGGGPLHTSAVAASLDMREVIVPPAPGILCAAGLNVSDLKEDFVRTSRVLVRQDASIAELEANLRALHARATQWFEDERIPAERRYVQVSLDMHYVGQNFELAVPIVGGTRGELPPLPPMAELQKMFFATHERTYGFHNPRDPVQILNCRMKAAGRRHRQHAARKAKAATPGQPIGLRPVWFAPDAPLDTPIYRREQLSAGQELPGPAVIEQMDTTTLIFPRDVVRVDDHLNLLIEINR